MESIAANVAQERAKAFGGRVAESIKSIMSTLTPATGLIASVSFTLHIVNMLTLHALIPGCLEPEKLFAGFGSFLLRCFSLVANFWLHQGIVMMGISVLLFIPFASFLEKRLGTFAFFYTFFVLLSLPISLLYLTFAFFASLTVSSVWTTCIQGLQPIVFALITIETGKADSANTTMGLPIPPSAIPWILLLIFNLVLPILGLRYNFLADLSGVIVGLAHTSGVAMVMMPSNVYFTNLDDSALLGWMSKLPTFVPAQGGISLPTESPTRNEGAGAGDTASSNWFERFRGITPSRSGYGAVGSGPGPNTADAESLLPGK
ncbi:hypothetical protein HK101_002901 [Irineochytrium annulatum]|nr:hypothetical protein HK101_002901 [Irineochytrium annulatum]